MSLLAVTSGDIASGVVEPEGVDFDGVNDYLSRSTDLVGNVDSKTFTFSAWVYIDGSGNVRVFSSKNGTYRNNLVFNNGSLVFTGKNTVGTSVINVSTPISINTFIHYIISCDLSYTSKRHAYINDINTISTWHIYLNQSIKFTAESHVVSADEIGVIASKKCRLSNIFLDYTYRDLSIEANRRLFYSADGKPTPTATLKALNPILYLPMKDASTAHINEGTGGNFVQNGTLDTASRGANQDNCVSSYFDGTADYLSRTSLTGVADGKVFTFSCNFNTYNTVGRLLTFWTSTTSIKAKLSIQVTTVVSISAQNAAGTTVLLATLPIIQNKNYNLSISLDLSNSSLRKMIVNGVDVTSSVSWTTYLDDLIDLAFTVNTPAYSIGYYNTTYHLGNIGELYFDTRYIDLATSNPFWDADTNRPKPVRQVIRETGVVPLIAMPLDASNAGKNYGTGGDFTANSAPYVGVRGGSEFWARSAKFDGSTGYLSRGALTGAVNSKTFSFVLPIYKTTSTIAGLLQGLNPSLYFVSNSANQIQVYARNASNSITLNAITTESIPINTWGLLFVCIDMSNTANRFIYFGNIAQTVTWSTYINDSLGFNNTGYQIGNQTSNYLNGSGHGFYFTTDYIDFSQETNRLKFVDGLGYPLDLRKQIDAGVIPKPLIYLPFNDPSNLGLNLGTGGNFTVNGAVTAGADVLG